MDSHAVPPRLRELVERTLADQERNPAPALPDPRPAPDESREVWVARVRRARSQHDAYALENAARYGHLGDRDDPVGSVEYVEVPVRDDVIAARVYRPIDTDDAPPAIVVLHGGGWWMGGGAQGYRLGDGLCRMLCHGLGAVVVNVDYRLAPEHPFPVQLLDVRDTIAWLRRGEGPRVDPARIAVAGTSSGGHIAATVSQLIRDAGEPALAMQLLIAPAVDVAGPVDDITDDPVLAEGVRVLRRYYAEDEPDKAIPYLSPVRAPDLTGLPPAIFLTGDFDPLTPPAVEYARRLREADVPVEHLTVSATHTLATPGDWRAAEEQVLAACRRFLG